MKNIKAVFLNQDGSAGIMAIILMLLIAAIGAGMYNLSTTELKIDNNLGDGAKAQYLAEEGAQFVSVELIRQFSEQKGSLYDSVKNLQKGGANPSITKNKKINSTNVSYTYTISWPKDQKYPLAVVTGKVNNAYRTVAVPIIISANDDVFNYSIFGGGGNIMLSANDVLVDGSIRANSIINISNGTEVRGDVIAGGNIDNKGNVDPKKYKVLPNSSRIDTTQLIDKYKYSDAGTLWLGKNNDTNVTLESNTTIPAGTYHIEGDLTLRTKVELSAQNSGKVIIYVKGNCNFEPDSKVEDGNFLIISSGMNIKESVRFNKAVLISTYNIILGPDSEVIGSVVSLNGDVNLHTKARITYESDFVHDITGTADDGSGVSGKVGFGDWNNH